MKYFKIVTGYREDEFIGIDENELPKAQFLFLEGSGRGLFSGGAVRGQDIIRIVPDWHKVMGWNQGYKMTTSEYNDVKHLERGYRETYNDAKKIVTHVLSTGEKELLNKPIGETVRLLGGSDNLMIEN